MKYFVFLASILLLIGILGCGGAPASNPTAAPTNSSGKTQPTTAVAQPTNAPAPTTAPLPTNPPAPTQVAAPTTAAGGDLGSVKPPEGAPFDVVKKSLLNVFTANTVRANTNIETGDGSKSTLLLEYIKPDRMHIVQSDGGESIAIKGKGVWTKKDGKWEAEDAQMADMLFGFIAPEAIQESLKTMLVESVQFVGPELLDGKPTLVYTYKTKLEFGDTTSSGTGKIWIGALDGRPYRGESESESISTKGKLDKTLVVYEYDVPITIEPPQ